MVSLSLLIRVFEKARPHSDGYRMDSAGNRIRLDYYTGERNWELDHIIPKSKGGANHINNYQALEASTNNYWRARMEGKPGLTKKVLDNPDCWVGESVERYIDDRVPNYDYNYLSSLYRTRNRVRYIDNMTDVVRERIRANLTGRRAKDRRTIERYSRQNTAPGVNMNIYR
jgi:hypothetical protein